MCKVKVSVVNRSANSPSRRLVVGWGGGLILLALLLSSCATPEELARADVMLTAAPQATAVFVEHQETIYHATATALANAMAEDAMALERQRARDDQALTNEMLKADLETRSWLERQQIAASAFGWIVGAFTVAVVALLIGASILAGGTAIGRGIQKARIASLPPYIQLPNDLLLVGGQMPMLVDTITGAASPLNNPAGVSILREQYRERLAIVSRMADAAEYIARDSKSPQPADWLAAIVSATPTSIQNKE